MERSLGEFSGMVGNDNAPLCLRMKENKMASRRVIQLETILFED